MPKQIAPSRSAARGPQLDRVFKALSDPTRRAVLARLCRGPAAVSELAGEADMALPSFTQHLDMLEACGLVHSEKNGRVRTYQLDPKTLQLAETWLDEQRAIWSKRLDQLDTYLLSLKGKKP